jgi:predicted ArsR family transcriptional regulator
VIGPLPSELHAFVLDHVESFEQLEILVLLLRDRARAWTDAETAAELRLDPSSARASLEELERHGLAARGEQAQARPAWCFRARDPALDALATRLARAYAEQRVAVVELMAACAVERIRTSALRTFAEAFRLRGGGRKDG